MMDDFETNLASALRSAIGEPPTEIDPAGITRTARPGRARPFVAPVATALVIAAVAVTVLALAHAGGGKPQQAASPPGSPTASALLAPTVSRRPSDLAGFWILTDLQGLDGAAHTAPDSALTFSFDPSGQIGVGCSAARVTVGEGTLHFVHDWVTSTQAPCPQLGLQQSRFLFGQVLNGAAIWEIRDGSLAVHRGGDGAVFQRVARTLTVAQRALAVRTAKAEAWASPPSGNPGATSGVRSGRALTDPGWPSNVDQASAIVTTHADAMQYVGAAGGDTTSVLVIRLIGDFSWVTTGPPGHGPATGNVMTLVIDAKSGETIDAGLERQSPTQPLPHPTVLYVR